MRWSNSLHQFIVQYQSSTWILLTPATNIIQCRILISADIKQLIQLEEVCELTSLGPNGAFIYCMQFLLTNISWLLNIIEKHKPQYIVFDTPGQVELYAIDGLVRDLLNKLSASNISLCCVHLIDCQYCTDINKYISATFLTLSAMIQIEKPFVNV
jgi:hypothetical protein